MNSVLITGASGFIGSNFIQYLLKKNLNLKIFAISNRNKINYKNSRLKIIKSDLVKDNLIKILPKKIDCIIHLASIRQPYLENFYANEQINTNFIMTSKLLEYARNFKINNFIFASTIYVYSGLGKKKFIETMNLSPNEPLGYSKFLCEDLIKFYSQKYKINSTIFRISTTYGPNSSKSQFIPIIINKLLSRKPKVLIDKLGLKRDFIYIEDVIEVLNRSLEKVSNQKKYFEVFNLSSGYSTSTNLVVLKLIKLLKVEKKRFKLKMITPKKIDFHHQISNKKLVTIFKYKPKYLITEGLNKLISDEY